jgi:DDE_Tnp_1-associated
LQAGGSPAKAYGTLLFYLRQTKPCLFANTNPKTICYLMILSFAKFFWRASAVFLIQFRNFDFYLRYKSIRIGYQCIICKQFIQKIILHRSLEFIRSTQKLIILHKPQILLRFFFPCEEQGGYFSPFGQGWLFLNPLIFSIFFYLCFSLTLFIYFMTYDFGSYLATIPDFRRKQGQRYPLAALLTISLMAILSQKQGLRDFARFAQANAQTLTTLLNLKHGVPKYATFQSLFRHLSAQVLTDKFVAWLATYSPVLADKYIALDGKVVQSTVSGGNTSLQNFISVVSAFGQQSGLTYGMQAFQNNKSGEGQALRDLVEKLGLQGKVYTADALHCQKKL